MGSQRQNWVAAPWSDREELECTMVIPETWNFPLLMLAWKIGPALAAGCSVVVKPAAETSLTALKLAELAGEAVLPRGVLNFVTGSGAEAGEPLGRHPGVDMVSFGGSTVTGRRFLHYSADSNLKEVVLDLGGKNPCMVLNDVEDLDAAAAHVVNGAFWNMGQNCSPLRASSCSTNTASPPRSSRPTASARCAAPACCAPAR